MSIAYCGDVSGECCGREQGAETQLGLFRELQKVIVVDEILKQTRSVWLSTEARMLSTERSMKVSLLLELVNRYSSTSAGLLSVSRGFRLPCTGDSRAMAVIGIFAGFLAGVRALRRGCDKPTCLSSAMSIQAFQYEGCPTASGVVKQAWVRSVEAPNPA